MSGSRRIEHVFDASAAHSTATVLAGSALPRPVGADVLAALQDVADDLRVLAVAAREAARWDGATRAACVRVLDGLEALVTAARAPVLVAQHAAAAAVGTERSFVDTRARLTGTTRFGAARQVGSAQAMTALPQVAQAVLDQAMPTGHVDVLGRVLAEASPEVSAALASPATQEHLIDQARQTDQRQFARTVAALVAAHDPDAVEDAREASRRARFLTVTHGHDATFLKGRLDPLAGQVLARALEGTGHRADPERTGDQARADALTALAQHTLSQGRRLMPDGDARPAGAAAAPDARAGVHPADRGGGRDGCPDAPQPDGATAAPAAQVNLLVPAETWLEVRRHQQARRGRRPSGVGVAAPTVSEQRAVPVPAEAAPTATPAVAPPAVSDDGVVLTRTELAAALCDCAMTRVVMSEQGLPLDVGRSRRMFTPAQRTAVIARDRKCAWNGCSTTARHSQLHHIRWWHRDAGRSDLDNAVLLCSFHHPEVHRLDLDVRRLGPPGPADPPGGRSRADATPVRPRGDVLGEQTVSGRLLASLPGPQRYVFVDRAGREVNGVTRDNGATRDNAATPRRAPGPPDVPRSVARAEPVMLARGA